MADCLLALDQGTSSSRSIVFDARGQPLAMAQQELTQHYPRSGWVEHDPMEIWHTQRDTARAALAQAGLRARDIRAVGITNQRETTVVWRRSTGQPIYPAIVWQDRRTEPDCAALRAQGLEDAVRQRTGLRIDAYFSATKLQWILNHVPGARLLAQRGELAFGTVDSWLIWNLTGGAVHATDVSNASRTMLWNVHTSQWDPELLQALDIEANLLPRVQSSMSDFGATDPAVLGAPIPIGGVAGDQQSALFGQACFAPGQVKNTYGTGCFMLMHTGASFQTSTHGLITTRAAQCDAQAQYALEGSVFVGGAVVQWLRDGLRAIRSSAEVQALAESVPDSGGVTLVPAFTGLGAPYWVPDARGTIVGLSRGSTVAHIARAALESIAFQSAALLRAMQRDAATTARPAVTELRVDGGACVNDLLMQFQADLLGIPVLRPRVTETTALGAAYLAGLQAGVFADTDSLSAQWQVQKRFEPAMPAAQVQAHWARWEQAVAQTLARAP
ncbi:MAG: glycerol kinase GlpK [Rhodoferax sp.]